MDGKIWELHQLQGFSESKESQKESLLYERQCDDDKLQKIRIVRKNQASIVEYFWIFDYKLKNIDETKFLVLRKIIPYLNEMDVLEGSIRIYEQEEEYESVNIMGGQKIYNRLKLTYSGAAQQQLQQQVINQVKLEYYEASNKLVCFIQEYLQNYEKFQKFKLSQFKQFFQKRYQGEIAVDIHVS